MYNKLPIGHIMLCNHQFLVIVHQNATIQENKH